MTVPVKPLTERHVKIHLPTVGGSYILLLKVTTACEIAIGSKGMLNLRPGYYLYVGSAFGPGGLRARVGRHARVDKVHRWHIDYLRAVSQLLGVFYSMDASRLEDDWAEAIQAWPDIAVPMPGFGASDSHTLSHLFYSRQSPDQHLYRDLAGQGGEFLTA